MSILALLFSWTKLPQWALELLVIAGLAGGFWMYHRHVYDTGIRAQQTADKAASAKAVAKAKAETIAAQRAANAAQDAYHAEIARLASEPPLAPVRLCLNTYVGSPGLPEAGASKSGDAHSSATAGGVRQVPAGNTGVRPGSGPDIAGLLDALGRRADEVSATLREFQLRGHP